MKLIIDKSLGGGGTLSISDILLLAHPVGSYYWSDDSTNPSELFGGIWVQIKDKFIVAAGDSHTAGTQYGRKTINLSHSHTAPAHTHTTGNHTLTVAEMPGHKHGENVMTNYASVGAMVSTYGQGNKVQGYSINDANGPMVSMTNKQILTDNTGGGQAHNHGNTGSAGAAATTAALNSDIDITPLSVAAYCWKRTE